MTKEIFRTKQFSVTQTSNVFRINTDGLVLSSWAELRNPGRILDLGTGTGIMALVAAQRTHTTTITAIDIQESAVELARENFSLSPWRERLEVIHSSVVQLTNNPTSPVTFDHILSNPPFYLNSFKSKKESDRISRHQVSLTLSQLLHCAYKLLAVNGSLSLIYPFGQKDTLARVADDYQFSIMREATFYSLPGRPERVLFTLRKGQANRITENIIMYNEDKSYHRDYIALMKDILIIF